MTADADTAGDLPPSASFVAYVLRESGPLTRQELVAETDLSTSTVHWALSRLEDGGLLERGVTTNGQPTYDIDDM